MYVLGMYVPPPPPRNGYLQRLSAEAAQPLDLAGDPHAGEGVLHVAARAASGALASARGRRPHGRAPRRPTARSAHRLLQPRGKRPHQTLVKLWHRQVSPANVNASTPCVQPQPLSLCLLSLLSTG